MSPVFRHGRLRLYLLKLLEESPRHGYDIIRLLEDRFLGVYAPSAGTIYPRLARLEEEGLVTHDREGGRKVYRLTDAGRAELHARMDELADLESEIDSSVRDIAREVQEDVRDSVRGLREEIKHATRDIRDGKAGQSRQAWAHGWEEAFQQAHHHAREARERAQHEGMNAGMREGMNAWRAAWEGMQSAWQETGPASQPPHTGNEEADSDAEARQELAEILRQFHDTAAEAAQRGHVDRDALHACRSVLDDTLTALRATLRA